MDSHLCLSNTSTEEFSDFSGKNILSDGVDTNGVRVGDLPSSNKHEPLDASCGAQIMAREVGVSFLLV